VADDIDTIVFGPRKTEAPEPAKDEEDDPEEQESAE
jgi:hypothetical protein